MEQRTDAWYSARLGKLTASRMTDAANVLKKGGDTEKRSNYRLELIAERFTGKAADFFENYAMKWGTDCEPLARSAYEVHTGNIVSEVGFIDHPNIEWAGASPDGLVHDGLLEIKCPNTTTHIKYLLSGEVPEQYKYQMLWQMLCTQRKWCDFVSYDPRMPEELRLFVVRYTPTESELIDAELIALDFLNSVTELEKQLTELPVGLK